MMNRINSNENDNNVDVDVENMIMNNYSNNNTTTNKDNRNCNSPFHNNIRISSSPLPSPSPSSSSSSITALAAVSSPITPRFSHDRRKASIVNKKYAELNGYDNDVIKNDDNDINDEEDGDFLLLQRKNYKNRALHDNNAKRLPSPLHLKDDDNNNNINNNHFLIKSDYQKIRNEKKINAITQCMDRILNKKHIIIIKDYDFLVKTLYLVLGETVEFRLASDVPLHAEHQLQGESDKPSLRFESPLLIQEENTSYAFTPKCKGEINVCCKIYSEMSCEVIVVESIADVREISKANNNISITGSNYFKDEEEYYIYKNKEDIKKTSMKLIAAFTKYCYHKNAEADVGLGCKVYFNGSIKSESESFCDSDDFLSIYSEPKEDDNTYCLLSPTRNVDHSYSPNPKVSVDNKDINTTQDHSHFKVYIEDFAFRPAAITVPIFSKVDFITDGNASHKLNCDDEYEDVSLEGTGACYSHTFKKVGKYRVCDEIFSFMCCVIHVVPAEIQSKEEKQENEEENEEDYRTLNYGNVTIQDTTESLIDTIASVCLNNGILRSLSNDSFDPDDDDDVGDGVEISIDDIEARRKAKKSKKKKAQRAKKRQEEQKLLNTLALIERENNILDSNKKDNMQISSNLCDSGDKDDDDFKHNSIEHINYCIDHANPNYINNYTNHDITDEEINASSEVKVDDGMLTNDCNIVNISVATYDIILENNNNVINNSIANDITSENSYNSKNKREKKRRVRKSTSQKSTNEINSKTELIEDTQTAIESPKNADYNNNEKKVETDIYALIQEKLNKSLKTDYNSNIYSTSNSPQSKPPLNMPPIHEIEKYVVSMESFFHASWNEINFTGSYTDKHGIIYIKERDNDKSSDNGNGSNHKRRRERSRRKNTS